MSEESPKTAPPKKLDPKAVESYSKIILAFVAVLGLFWGVFKYLDAREREFVRHEFDQRKQAETRRIEATRPYLERQLKLCTEATQVASRIATAKYGTSIGASDDSASANKRDASVTEDPVSRFWELYWGELALVEDERVERAMKKYGDALLENASPEKLQGLSLSLAHACRDSLAKSWGAKEWKRPTYGTE